MSDDWGTTYITVACVSNKRWFDLDSERTEHKQPDGWQRTGGAKYQNHDHTESPRFAVNVGNPAGAPPLDCWFADKLPPDPPRVDPSTLERQDMSEARFIVGDVFEEMAKIPDGSIDLVVTSPPFLKQRSYLPDDHPLKHLEIGSEDNPAMFLSVMLALTREWRRILAPHGSIAVELGDKYSGSGGAGGDYDDDGLRDGQPKFGRTGDGEGWPLAKSLCLLPTLYPASLAYGRNLLQPDDQIEPWRVRNLIVWHRPNPPVGALGDKVRPSTSYITTACVSDRRWFDLDAERTAGSPNTHARLAQGVLSRPVSGKKAENPNNNYGSMDEIETAGAPLLDCWTIPTAPFNGWGETVRHDRVPADAGDDGSQRTTSPDCPVHGSQDRQGSSARGGGRGAGSSNRNGHSGDHPALELGDDSPPTSSTHAPTVWDVVPGDPAATGRSKSSNRTDRAPSTSHVDTPSVGTPRRTDDTPTSPASAAPRLDTLENSTSSRGSAESREPQTASRTADNPSAPGEQTCTCSFYRVVTTTERTSHYATFPPALPRRLINLMCPRQVCVVCGEPRRRIVEANYVDGNGHPAEAATWSSGIAEGKGAHSLKPTALPSTPTTLGWTDCGHNTWRRGLVLDCFGGSGTTAMAASELGRDSISIDIDERNLDLARSRLGMFLVEEETVP